MNKTIQIILISVLICTASSCATNRNATPVDKRDAVINMRSDVLAQLYSLNPDAKAQVAASPGYAVFSNANVSLIFANFGGGYGVVENKRLKQSVFMKMGEAGVGLGLGVKDFRAVFIFKTQESLDAFLNNGWEFGGHVDAAAKTRNKGGAVGAETLLNGVTIYQITERGLALQASIKGTKFWQDAELNR